MEQYINKDALVAEIERLVNNHDKALDYEAALEDVRNFLDSLEVKEVDLEKEFDKCCENYVFDDECEVYTAKHFFELGLNVSKG